MHYIDVLYNKTRYTIKAMDSLSGLLLVRPIDRSIGPVEFILDRGFAEFDIFQLRKFFFVNSHPFLLLKIGLLCAFDCQLLNYM